MKRLAWKQLAWLTVPFWLGPLAWFLAYQPTPVLSYAGLVLLCGEMILVFIALAAAAVILVGPVLHLTRSRHRPSRRTLLLAVLFLVSFVGGQFAGRAVWRDCVRRFTGRGDVLTGAIHRFAAEQGRPPGSLAELVPQYLPAVPATGIGTTKYEYVTGRPDEYDGNPWALIVSAPSYPMGFDLLIYFPRQNYPDKGYGGWVERVGAWAYVHE